MQRERTLDHKVYNGAARCDATRKQTVLRGKLLGHWYKDQLEESELRRRDRAVERANFRYEAQAKRQDLTAAVHLMPCSRGADFAGRRAERRTS